MTTTLNDNDNDKVVEEIPDSDDDVSYVKYVPPQPNSPVQPLHPREWLQQKVKNIREKKGKV